MIDNGERGLESVWTAMHIMKKQADKLQVFYKSDCFEQQMISGELRAGALAPRVLWSKKLNALWEVIMKTKVMDQQFIDFYVPLMGRIFCGKWLLLAFSQ